MSEFGNLARERSWPFEIDGISRNVLDALDLKKISQYLNEDLTSVENSAKILTSNLLNEIASQGVVNEDLLAELVSMVKAFETNYIKFSHSQSNIIELNLDSKTFDKSSDFGTLFLKQLFQADLYQIVKKLSKDSKLKEESDFTLLALISSEFLCFLKSIVDPRENNSLKYSETLKSLFTSKEIATSPQPNKPQLIIQRNEVLQAKKRTSSFLHLLLLLPFILIILSILDFFYMVRSSGRVSGVSFEPKESLVEVNETPSLINIFDKIVNRLNLFNVASQTKIIGDEVYSGSSKKVVEPQDFSDQILKVKETYSDKELERKIGVFIFSVEMPYQNFKLAEIGIKSSEENISENSKTRLANIARIINSGIRVGISIRKILIKEHSIEESGKDPIKGRSLKITEQIKKHLAANGVDEKIISIAESIDGNNSISENNGHFLELNIQK